MSYLGIDIGSSCVKAVAFQADGKRLAMARRGYEFLSPTPGAMELDSTRVLTAACGVIAEVAAQTVADPIRALAISSQGEAITPVDRTGRPLANAMISGDSRAADAMMRFTEKFGAQKLYRITGHTPSAMFSLAKLLWLAEQRPQVRRQHPRRNLRRRETKGKTACTH